MPNNLTGTNISDTYQRLVQVSSSGQVTDGTGSLLPLTFNSDGVTITGTLHANTITSSRITSSVIYTSGSSTFGDEASDTHTFTGAITGSGLRIPNSSFLGSSLSDSTLLIHETDSNNENLSFIFHIVKLLNVKENLLFQTLRKFKGLKYRQQIIYQTRNLTIINDSKATSFSSSESLLKSLPNAKWIVGGLFKKGDKFLLSKNQCKNLKAYIFGKNKKLFINELKDKIEIISFNNLNLLVKKIIRDIKLDKLKNHQTIIFSPAGASFDSFKNFEARGEYFNNLIIKNIDGKQ